MGGVVELVAEGIDTFANVNLNGVPLWSQSDAFRRSVIDVTQGLILSGDNAIDVFIASTVQSAANAAAAACSDYCPPMYRNCGSFAANASSWCSVGLNYARSSPVSGGWDFAPNLPQAGISKDIYLRGYVGAVLEDASLETIPKGWEVGEALPRGRIGVSWNATFTVYVRVPLPPAKTGSSAAMAGISVVLTVSVAGASNSSAFLLQPTGGIVPLQVDLQVPSAAAWWPNGLGAPTLYNATVSLSGGGADGGNVSLSSLTFPVAFKTIEQLRPPSPDGTGALYYYAVNGVPLYAKGANWVPADAFPTRAASPGQHAPKLESFAAANFNMLRVWGGGRPESDDFYTLAAANGLLIWQEMPFACAIYPVFPSFLEDVSAETADIVRRLRKAPSLAAFGGNNEIAWITPAADKNASGLGNYSALFFGAVGATVLAVGGDSRPYLVSSPGSGSESPDAPMASPPMQSILGDVHNYNYNGDCWDPSIYPRPRAVSEFGWQSYSNLFSLAEVISPPNFSYWSDAMMRRDTHGSQQPGVILFQNVGTHWKIPGLDGRGPTDPDARNRRLVGAAAALATAARAANATSIVYQPRADGTAALPTDALGILPIFTSPAFGGPGAVNGTIYRDTLLLTQLAQAQCVKTEAERYRRLQSSCPPGGAGGCTMMSLYWMASDLWPAATKGGIEWSGRWKALQHAAARFYAPLLVSPWMSPSNASNATDPASAPFGVSLSAHPPASNGAVPNGTLVLSCWSWASGHLGDARIPFSVPTADAWGPAPAVVGPGAGGAIALLPPNMTIGSALASCGCVGSAAALSQCVLAVAAYNASAEDVRTGGGSIGGLQLGTNWLFPSPLRNVSTMRDPGLAITDVTSAHPESPNDGFFIISITASTLPAVAVWVESLLCCGFFSDNAFLMTTSPVTLLYTPQHDSRGWVHAPPPTAAFNVTAGQFAASLSITSLFDTSSYNE